MSILWRFMWRQFDDDISTSMKMHIEFVRKTFFTYEIISEEIQRSWSPSINLTWWYSKLMVAQLEPHLFIASTNDNINNNSLFEYLNSVSSNSDYAFMNELLLQLQLQNSVLSTNIFCFWFLLIFRLSFVLFIFEINSFICVLHNYQMINSQKMFLLSLFRICQINIKFTSKKRYN